jgi:TIR domain
VELDARVEMRPVRSDAAGEMNFRTPGGERNEKRMARTKIFISYSHEDERWRKRVVGHLAVLAMEGIIDLWDDRKLGAGEDWLARIHEQMLEARIAFLLVSSAFLTSKFIREKEVPSLFDQHEQGGMTIYPLLVKPCPWQEVAWLARMQLRPPGGKPVASYKGAKVDEVLVEVARESARLRELKNNEREETHRYRGRVFGDEIKFVMQTEGGFSEHLPIEFTAKKVRNA